MQTELQMLNEAKRDNGFLMKNYEAIREKYENEFVAIKNEKIIAHGKRIEDVISHLESRGINSAMTTIEFMREKNIIIVI
ncbi:MAG TPA: DUF5678 domain-containing protein [archaeon]|nr:DUF5678 domain-containing protein [archaeon]